MLQDTMNGSNSVLSISQWDSFAELD